jgi:PAS domain S-box-containing protein
LVPDLLWSGDASGRTTWFNRRWINYTGRSLKHFQAEGWLEAIHPDEREASNRTFQNAIDAGLSFQEEHRIRCHDGSFRWFLMRAEPVRDVAGRIIEWFGSATDIDEQKRAQEALLGVNKTLEQSVTQRTAELQSALDALEAETAERNQRVAPRRPGASALFQRHYGALTVAGGAVM